MRQVGWAIAWTLTLNVGAAAQTGPVTIRAGLLLDGRGGSRTGVDLVVEGDRISAIRAPRGTPTFDFSDLTVLPGAIDTHVHINWHFDPDGKTHHLGPEEESDAQAVLYAAENAYLTVRNGVTTVQSLGSMVDRDLRDAIARGTLPGPRILTSLGSLNERSGTPEEIRKAVADFHDAGADVIKIFASASIRVGGTPTMSQEQLNAACGEAHRLGLRSAVHAHGPESARRAVEAGCTSIEHGALLDQATLDLLAETGTYYDPNIHLIFRNYFENKEHYVGIGGYTEDGFVQMERAVPRALEVFQWALATPGLQIVFGTDAVAGAHGRNLEELIYRVQGGGQDPMAAIVSATSLAAQSLGLDDQIGSLAPGWQADIIAVEGNPLEDITALRRVVFVMRAGRVFKND